MSDSTRRGFLKVAGTGAAVAGVAAAVPAAAARHDARHHDATARTALPEDADGSIVAYVHNVHTGEMSVMVEGHEVTVTDHDLVARLARAVHDNSTASA